MKQKVLLLHGWGGSDNPHWQSWLAGEIAKDYGNVNFLQFSNFDNPDIKVWQEELIEALESYKPDIVICHSLANTLWFHLCNTQSIKKKIQKLILVAPPSLECNIEELKSFFPLKTPTELYAEKSILVTSTDDPYMSMQEAKSLQKNLNIEMLVLENAGHINADSGYGVWEWIYNEVKSSSKQELSTDS